MVYPRWTWCAEACPASELLGVVSHRVQGASMLTVAGLFNEFAQALAFPSYFGHNWDAFEECYRDAEWFGNETAAELIIDDADLVLSKGGTSDLDTFLSILNGGVERPERDDQFVVKLLSRTPFPPHAWTALIPSLRVD
ncbi:barstar family protein [Leifsonia sp. ZF2019]|uniref:barstar family protein n=1 Tax=Leifsonia sp. ZF2019 TaxID=2781978 RepID=UPI0021DAEB96|nr:barstar family protein [Leifsonia sp. ZF2019]